MTANHKTKTPPKPGAFCCRISESSLFLEEARKLLLEARDAAAAVHDLLGAAGPGRMRLRIDVEVQLVALLAPGGTGRILAAVGHHDRNCMIIRVNFLFHGISCGRGAPVFKHGNGGFGRLYNAWSPAKQVAPPSY